MTTHLSKLSVVVVLSTVLAVAGCHSTGQGFDSFNAEHITPGISLIEVVQLLDAEPSQRYYRPDGGYMARWGHVSSLVPDGIYTSRELWIDFDAADRVIAIRKRHNLSSKVESSPYTEP